MRSVRKTQEGREPEKDSEDSEEGQCQSRRENCAKGGRGGAK